MKQTLLTVQQAAELKGVSAKAIYAAIAAKRLPRRYRQGSLVVREADILAWESLKKKGGRPKGRPMTPEQKARISAAQKERWAKRKAAA
jgi:predicted DNA-binding transcriptional regulator AlpA